MDRLPAARRFVRRFVAGPGLADALGAPRLANRQDLWALLTTITACKAVNQIQHEIGVHKRGGACGPSRRSS